MSYWLVKSEPSVYSWEDFVKEGQTCWTGVRNYAARLHLRNMKADDEVLFYHSSEGMAVMGIAEVTKEVEAETNCVHDFPVLIVDAPGDLYWH